MKQKPTVSSSRRVSRRRHFQASSGRRRIIMSAPLSKELRKLHNVRSVPIRKDDIVCVDAGKAREATGKVIRCYRKKWKIYIEGLQRRKANGDTVSIGIHPSNVTITKLMLTKERKDMLSLKAASRTRVAQKYKDADMK
eukprot:GHVN01034000.1.p1 GENE.GHVN01034000.1~~GHVN01034000.1.p1  ORF type:complete len:139 (+),score=19.35 GHVN01034000.1:56-472(+)